MQNKKGLKEIGMEKRDEGMVGGMLKGKKVRKSRKEG